MTNCEIQIGGCDAFHMENDTGGSLEYAEK